MIFEIEAIRPTDNDKKIFYYNNETNALTTPDGGVFQYHTIPPNPNEPKEYVSFDKNNPLKKSKKITTLKIQLGLSCNYSCEYCSQKFVERPPETSKKHIDEFIKKLDVLEFSEKEGLRIELWGGEPFVYWKTMKPLVEAIWKKFEHWDKKPQFGIVTNGSLLTPEIIDWLQRYGFSVSISHDGPGQYVRGPDPLEDPEHRELILDFYKMQKKLGGVITFNSMLNAKNMSRKEIHDWFVNLTGDPDVILGEGGLVDAYDEDGDDLALQTNQEHFEFRKRAFVDFYNHKKNGFYMVARKIDGFTDNVLSQRNIKYVGQKCGMDDENTISIDLLGNVITCQNVTAAQTSMNGESHLAGTLDNYDEVRVKTSTHWSKRDHCSECPVVHLCRGACMFLEGKYWETSCANSYSDNITLFALSFFAMTGYIPAFIKNEHLPDVRRDIFGDVLEHKEVKRKKIIPIKVSFEKTKTVNGIEVYEKVL